MKFKTMVLAALMVMLVASAAIAAKKVYNFKGEIDTRDGKGLTKEQIAVPDDEGGFFSWTYTFMVYLDDDSSAMIQFTYWKFYLMDQRGLYFSYIDKGETAHYRQGIYDDDEMTYKKDPPDFKMGPHSWSGFYPDFDIKLDFPTEDGEPAMSADIHFDCRTPGWRPGEGPVHYGEPDGDWYDLIVMIPWAEVSGTITVDGKTKNITGWGYSDHNTQTVIPTAQTEELMALRSFTDDYAIHFLEYIAPEDYGHDRTTWLIIMKDDEIVYATDKWEREMDDYTTEPRRGYKYPQKMTFTIDQPGVKLTGELKGVKFIALLDAMDNLPGFIRSIAEKFITAPVFIRQNAVVEYKLEIPERSIDDEFTAKGVFETTIVR